MWLRLEFCAPSCRGERLCSCSCPVTAGIPLCLLIVPDRQPSNVSVRPRLSQSHGQPDFSHTLLLGELAAKLVGLHPLHQPRQASQPPSLPATLKMHVLSIFLGSVPAGTAPALSPCVWNYLREPPWV